MGDTVTVEDFEVGQEVKISGKSKGKGFQGTIKRHNFAAGPEVPRLAQRARPGLDRRLGDPVARVQGHPRARPHGRRARHPARPDDRRADPRPEPDARPRLRARGPRAAPWRCAPMADAPILGGTKKHKLDDEVFGVAVQRPARARGRGGRAGRAPPRHARDQDARHGPRRRRQAVAPEGHRPRPRRLDALADLDRRRHRLRPAAAPLHRQGQPQGAPRRAALRAVGARRRAARSSPSTSADFEAPSTKKAADADRRPPRRLGAGRARRGGVRRRQVLPQPRRASA